MMLHLMYIIADIDFSTMCLYALFIFVSIYAYTSLMDYSRQAPFVEGLKTIFALVIVFNLGTWFGLPAIVVILYCLTSVAMSIFILSQPHQAITTG